MLTGSFFLEIYPGQILWAEGPWRDSSGASDWEVAILPFQESTTAFLQPTSWKILTRHELRHFGDQGMLPSLNWQMAPRADFRHSFDSLQTMIGQGFIKKGVPFTSQSASCLNPSKFWDVLIQRIPQLPMELNVYGAEFAEEKALGASPEWLFRIDQGGHILHTMAVAGTRWPEQARDKITLEKEQEEHAWVVADLTERLRPYGKVVTEATTWVKAGMLEHLKTPLRLEASQRLLAPEMLKLLHPTPAVGVFPRSPEGLKWLHQLPESEIRADFGAPWVVQHRDGRAYALVALRQVRLRRDHMWIPAGCGVVQASDEEAEWDEIQTKILSVKKAWGLA